MADNTKIQWTDATWNVAVGCRKVDADCRFCYMYRDSFDGTRYNPREVRRTKTVFRLPLKLKEPSKIFVSSLTDFFIEEIDGYRQEAWAIIKQCPQHTFQILTKRPERIKDCLPSDWSVENYPNVWIGTSVGSNESLYRIAHLVTIPAAVRFVSFEPLHGHIDTSALDDVARYIDWVIIGGESGNDNGKYTYRPCEIKWLEDLVNYFYYGYSAAVFVKQLGTHLAKQLNLKADRHGGDINNFPQSLKIREFPV